MTEQLQSTKHIRTQSLAIPAWMAAVTDFFLMIFRAIVAAGREPNGTRFDQKVLSTIDLS